jgi:hypothetical protein
MATKAKSFDDFRKSHDKNFIIPEALKAGIAALTPTGWEYEGAFWKSLPVSTTDGAKFREQFNDFIVTVDRTKRIWCGSKALATKMREAL